MSMLRVFTCVAGAATVWTMPGLLLAFAAFPRQREVLRLEHREPPVNSRHGE